VRVQQIEAKAYVRDCTIRRYTVALDRAVKFRSTIVDANLPTSTKKHAEKKNVVTFDRT
jgi:hypothetical protein